MAGIIHSRNLIIGASRTMQSSITLQDLGKVIELTPVGDVAQDIITLPSNANDGQFVTLRSTGVAAIDIQSSAPVNGVGGKTKIKGSPNATVTAYWDGGAWYLVGNLAS